jgi:hypothetical protein
VTTAKAVLMDAINASMERGRDFNQSFQAAVQAATSVDRDFMVELAHHSPVPDTLGATVQQLILAGSVL